MIAEHLGVSPKAIENSLADGDWLGVEQDSWVEMNLIRSLVPFTAER